MLIEGFTRWAIMVQTKLCIVTHTFLPHVGGIEKVVYEQGKRLLQRNFEPIIVTSRLHTPKSYCFENLSVECYPSLNTGFSLGIPYPIPMLASFKTFLKAVKSSKIVHAHGHPYLSSLIVGELAKKYHRPFVLTQHNTFIEYDNMFDTVELVNDLVVGKETIKQADSIVAVSDASKKYLLDLGADPQKVKVIKNGVDLARFKPNTKIREQMRRDLHIHRDAIVFLTVRRLVYKNGIDTLIDCAALAVKNNPRVVFVAVGKGPDQSSVQAKINELGLQSNFRLVGFVSDEQLPSYYNLADFFILPSKSGEGLPLVALEAMACSLPVIATNTGCINEILSTDHGIIIPPNDPDTMTEAVLEFARQDFTSRKIELRAMVEEKFSWEKNVDSLVEIYEELI